ncbi:MAG: T9SS type A sorting domain-containing protein [Prevotella sp.]|nr:T9SS type A sorting domain-containing protein [Prevotella sp.]
MKRTLLFISCVLASMTMVAQEEANSYLPFVKDGKKWTVFRSDFDTGHHLEHYMLINEGIVNDGKTYMKMYRSEDDMTTSYDTGLFREEDRKVYIFDADRKEEHLMFDYALKAGDTYDTYSYDEQRMVTYKVLSVSNYWEGPKVVSYSYNEQADSTETQHRYLKKWTVCSTENESQQKTWIEGVGSLEGPLGNLHDVVLPGLTKDYLAYVEYTSDNYTYLPFPFYDTMNRLAHGSNLPAGAECHSEDWHHQLTYELEGDRLHVYGKAFTQCGPNNYAYFYERETDDPLVHKLEFEIQGVEPVPADCMALHATNFYVPGFDSNFDYVVVDNQGEEHPVINKTPKMAYRPFVEEGKVWKVGFIGSGNPVQLVEYYYFDGDTIIDGKTCRQMMCQHYANPNYTDADVSATAQGYVGAWYEEDMKVYAYREADNQFKLMYDFSEGINDTLQIDNQPYVIGTRLTGGLKGFKGVYREVSLILDERNIHSVPWLEGVGGTDRPTTNVYPGYVDPAWLLLSCTVGDEVIYLNDNYKDDATPDEARKRRFDFTHTTKIKPKSPMRRMAEASEEPSLYGEYTDQLLGINLNPLDDDYLVRITSVTGRTVYEKAVNAGNIVGLNIDISSLTEGSYTVTVENSNESFTGKFETQTEGISLVPALTRAAGAIYNLQGQLLQQKPTKGVYIQDGKKYVVK